MPAGHHGAGNAEVRARLTARAREALGASEADDPRLALALTARELDVAHAGPSRIPTLPASEVAPDDAGRELRFTPGFSPTPSFEIATDGPGFAVDEPFETMGEALSLPPFLESRRAQIEAGLKPLD